MSELSAIEWGVAARPFRGEIESGDQHVVAPFDGGVLAGAIDGLGHGPEAARVACRAAEVLSGDPARPVGDLIERCHAALRGSRGAVMTLAAIDTRTERVTWAAVGNVEATLCRASPDARPPRETIVPRSGVVGYQLPAPRAVSLPIAAGDVLIMATDGIGHDFVLDSPFGRPARSHAEAVLDRYGKETDDALVLVVRYLGRAP
ncbi:SpoIIE family protein phosphatase [Caulobacter sp. KR2-114]|uniref:SpoIIE family protein phosphatase n=1 Tax=Caulobacter sp. KR2-114 TaxID=3400912 RepID=UPI003C00E372